MSCPEPSDFELSVVRVSFDNDEKVSRYPLARCDYSDRVLFTTEQDGRPDILIKHPAGEVIAVCVEVWVYRDYADICITVLQRDDARAVARGANAVLLSYTSLQDNLFYLEVGPDLGSDQSPLLAVCGR